MGKHTLSLEDLEEFGAKSQLAGSFGGGENKSLDIVSKLVAGDILSMFVVTSNHQEQLQTKSLAAAIEEYNKH